MSDKQTLNDEVQQEVREYVVTWEGLLLPGGNTDLVTRAPILTRLMRINVSEARYEPVRPAQISNEACHPKLRDLSAYLTSLEKALAEVSHQPALDAVTLENIRIANLSQMPCYFDKQSVPLRAFQDDSSNVLQGVKFDVAQCGADMALTLYNHAEVAVRVAIQGVCRGVYYR